MWSLSRQGCLGMGLLTVQTLTVAWAPCSRMQGHPQSRLLRTVSFQVPPLPSLHTHVLQSQASLLFTAQSWQSAGGCLQPLKAFKPLNLHTWMHCTPGWGVGKRVASPKTSWSPANHATARLQPRCSRVHTLRGQNLTAEWGPPTPSDPIWLSPGCRAKRNTWLWESGWVGGQAIPRWWGASRRQVQAPNLCLMLFVPSDFTYKSQGHK